MGEKVIRRMSRRLRCSLLALALSGLIVAPLVIGAAAMPDGAGSGAAVMSVDAAHGAEGHGTGQGDDPVAVFIGDSYTYGAGRSSEAASFPHVLSGMRDWQVVSLARGGTGYATSATFNGCGARYCPTYREVIPEAVAAAPDLVIVSGGRNDLGTPGLERGVERFFDELRAALPSATIYVTSPLWGAEAAPASLERLSMWVEREAAEHDAVYLDLGDLYRGRPDLIQRDGVHPNDAGLALLAEAIDAAIARVDGTST